MEHLRKTNFDFPSCHSETTNSRQVNDVPLVSYSVWGLISTSKPQREDSIHLSLSSSSSCWQREPSAVWDKNQKSSRETLQRRSSSAEWGPHQFSFLLLNHCPFHRALVVYAQSYVIFLLRPFAAGCVRCFWYLVSDEGIFSLNNFWGLACLWWQFLQRPIPHILSGVCDEHCWAPGAISWPSFSTSARRGLPACFHAAACLRPTD